MLDLNLAIFHKQVINANCAYYTKEQGMLKQVKKLLSFMLMLALMITLLPAGGKINARAAEEAASRTFMLYVYYEGTEQLTADIWKRNALDFTASDVTSDAFGWEKQEAALQKVPDKDNWYQVEFEVKGKSSDDDGFDIYTDKGTTKFMSFGPWDNTNKAEYEKLFTGKSAYILKDWTITDNLSAIGGSSSDDNTDPVEPEPSEPEEDKSDEVLDADLSDAIRGMDVSSYISLQDSFDALNAEEGTEKYGFKDNDGNIIKDQAFFNFLASTGMNYVRLRVWNNPYDANGNGYGGGNNDLAKAIEMGKYATNAGMKVLIDFHNSDFWADPAKQSVPKAWEGKSEDELATAVADYTTESLNKLLDAGVNVTMVQVGNETHGWMCGIVFDKNDPNKGLNKLLDAGCDAVHEVAANYNREILAVVHFANPTGSNEESYAWNMAQYDGDNDGKKEGVSYDVFATSYYPYWHGSLENLRSVLHGIAKTYGKKVMVAETSYANTLKDFDGHGNTVRKGTNDTGDDLVWAFNELGQAEEFQAVEKAVRSIAAKDGSHAGLGAFYWEGTWIDLINVDGLTGEARDAAIAKNKELWEKYGSGWAASFAGEYDAKDAGKWYGGSAVDNQCFFDENGYPRKSITTFSPDYKPFELTAAPVSAECGEEVETEAGSTITAANLPETAIVVFDDDSSSKEAVVWSENDIASANAFIADNKNVDKTFTVNGTVTINGKEFTVACTVKLVPRNLFANPSFEDSDESGWMVSSDSKGLDVNTDGSAKIGTNDPRTGAKTLHFWYGEDFTFNFSKEVAISEAGTYEASIYAQGGDVGDSSELTISASCGDTTVTSENVTLEGWKNWKLLKTSIKVTDEMIKAADGKLTITVNAKMPAKAWGSFDDATLVLYPEEKIEPAEPDKPSDNKESGSNSGSSSSGNNSNSSSSGSSSNSSSSGNGSSSTVTVPETPAVTVPETKNEDKPQTEPAAEVKPEDKGDKTVTETAINENDKTPSSAAATTSAVTKTTKIVKATLKTKKGSSKTYCYNSKGKLVRSSIVKSGSRLYITDKKGAVIKNKLVKLNGKYYIAGKSGALKKNTWVTIKNKRYYVNKNGVVTKTKTIKKTSKNK